MFSSDYQLNSQASGCDIGVCVQVLGGAGSVQPGGAAAGPGHQPAALLLPHLPRPQVRLPRLVHGARGLERQ